MTDPEPDAQLEAEFDDRLTQVDPVDEAGSDLITAALLAGDDEDEGEETADEQRVAQFDQFDEDWRR